MSLENVFLYVLEHFELCLSEVSVVALAYAVYHHHPGKIQCLRNYQVNQLSIMYLRKPIGIRGRI